MNRKKIAAANWKMNTTVPEGKELLENIKNITLNKEVDVIICAPATHLCVLNELNLPKNISLGAQNMSDQQNGAFTGEISADMVLSTGATYIVIGHSERREYFNESEELLGRKLKTALEKNLTPIFCCGEALEIRKSGKHVAHVIRQLTESFTGMSGEALKKIIIAYEPIWAIGTGETASSEQAQEMHASIRDFLATNYGSEISDIIPILYGGSVKPANAAEIFGKPDVDGGLIGGASLNADSFSSIVNSF